MAHTISYSDFLKEGALKESSITSDQEATLELKPFHISPDDVATESESKAYWKKLRQFFRTGNRPEGKNGVLVPALIAPYLRSGSWEIEYPFYLAAGNESGKPLEELIKEAIKVQFKADEAKILRHNMPRLMALFRKKLKTDKTSTAFIEVKRYAFEKLALLEVHDEEGDRFRADLKKLGEALPAEGIVFDFSHEAPLLIIRQNLERIEVQRSTYKNAMLKRVEELRELLKLDEEKEGINDEVEKAFEFADDLITLDKVLKMAPKKGSSTMREDRVSRIKELISILDDTLNGQENRAHLVINEDLREDFRWSEIFTSSKVSFSKLDGVFERVENIFDDNIGNFTQVIIAMHKSKLELEGKYDPEVHDDYFSHFKWFKLDVNELALFPPVMLVTGGFHLLQEGMADFSNLLVTNKPIKVLALTNRTTNEINPKIDWEDASHSFRQELAALALSHRGAHTLQCAADKPACMRSGIAEAIKTTSPAFMHLLVPAKHEDTMVSFLKINAAAAGRFFPYIAYDCQQGSEWGSRFDIASNAQPDKDWANYEFTYLAEDGNEVSKQLPFTYADYKAMDLKKVEELMIVPESMVADYLVPIHEYLSLSQTELTGKIPYIWLIGEDNEMKRAAVPYMWAKSCQERLDFWNFIQELGGVNSYHVKQALQREKVIWEKNKDDELDALKGIHKIEVEEVRSTAAGEALEKLTSILLGNLSVSDTLNQNSLSPPASAPEKSKVKAEEPKEAPEKEDKPKPPVPENIEPYVDTFRCTSCNDCTEKFPSIFEYNEDKQAEVIPDFKGTYEQLVIAAEVCPAACIHPGDPQNTDEPDLDELKKRAAKFN